MLPAGWHSTPALRHFGVVRGSARHGLFEHVVLKHPKCVLLGKDPVSTVARAEQHSFVFVKTVDKFPLYAAWHCLVGMFAALDFLQTSPEHDFAGLHSDNLRHLRCC